MRLTLLLATAFTLAAASPALAQKLADPLPQAKMSADLAEWVRIEQQISAGEFEPALAGLSRLIDGAPFKDYPVGDRHMLHAFRIGLAMQMGRPDDAHRFARAATQMDDAEIGTWDTRLMTAQLAKDWDDVGAVLIVLADRDPEVFETFPDGGVARLVRMVGDGPGGTPLQSRVIDALFDSGYDHEASYHWLIRAGRLVDAGQDERALAMVRRITVAGARMGLVVDRRFDRFRDRAPEAFDVVSARRSELAEARQKAETAPDDLTANRTYAEKLLNDGDAEQALAVVDAVLARSEIAPSALPMTPEQADGLIWTLDLRSRILYALGRHDEAVTAMRRAARRPENGRMNVSHAINLGALYNRLDRSELALDAVLDIDDDNASGFGVVQAQQVRACAFADLGRTADLQAAIDDLKARSDDADQTLGSIAACTGDADMAAHELIARLEDPERRIAALRQVQILEPAPHPSPDDEARHRFWESIQARPDVRSVIDRVGRIERWPFRNTYG